MEEIIRELNPQDRADVRKRYPDVYFPDPVKEPVWYGRREHTRITDKKAIIDQHNGLVFGICSDQYKIIPYEDIISLVEDTVNQIKNFGKIIVDPHTYIEGARLRVGLSFPDKKSLITKIDDIIPKMDIFSSLDLSTKLRGKFGSWQLKCTNGMGVWKTFKQFSKRHLQNLFIGELATNIGEGLDMFDVQIGLWKNWAKTKITLPAYEEIWEALPFSPAERIKIEALPEIGTKMIVSEALKSNELNMWNLNSVLTQFATHDVKSELRRIDLESEIAKVMEMAYSKK